jgi:prophage regulatory protein
MNIANHGNRILRMRDLPAKVGLRPSTIYQLVAEGKFPPPFKLVIGGRASGWLEEQIDTWLATQSSHRAAVVSPTGRTNTAHCERRQAKHRGGSSK